MQAPEKEIPAMTLPVNDYEELLDQVRALTNETILLQDQLTSDLLKSETSTDVNHNLSLIRKNYDKGIDLENSVISQYGQSSFPDLSLTFPSENQSRSLQSGSVDSLNAGIKIPPGDPRTRLIAWRRKNRPLISLGNQGRQQQQQQQVEQWASGSQEGGGGGGERRRPVSLHGPREDVLFGSGVSWRPASSILGYAAEPAILQPLRPLQLGPDKEQSMISPESAESAPDADDERAFPSCAQSLPFDTSSSGMSTPESYTKSGKSYHVDECGTEDEDHPSSSVQCQRLPTNHGTLSVKQDPWNSSLSAGPLAHQIGFMTHSDSMSAMSFSSEAEMNSSSMQGQRRLGAKMDVVYSLLNMLGSTEGREDMSATFLSMSNSVESCIVMRESGCLPLLIQLIHAPGQDSETRERASRALYNIVHARADEKSSRREVRVLRLLEQLRDYCQSLRNSLESMKTLDDVERHPGATIAALMKLSFDEAHRHAMCQLGGLHAVAELIEADHVVHGSNSDDPNCITLRRYAGMALTNLTFGDSNNKALLCSFHEFMKALILQLKSPSDDLRQVTASVLRNLSWRADSSSKQTLREVGAVVGLMKAAMEGRKESTLKSILSALWNLSAHCSTNKTEICAVEGALAFLVDMLNYNAPSKTLAIVENAGGILRNVSSHIAVRDDYRAIVRERGCLQVLLRQLRSPSLTVVSNACGALWNLSARCPHDQKLLWDLGAVPMLRSLIHSKHKMISMGSSAALKNLLTARPNGNNIVHLDSTARGLGLPTLPSLMARRQKALEQEIDQNLAETCDNIEPSTSPINKEDKFSLKIDQSFLDNSNRNGKLFLQPQLHSPTTNQPGPSGLKCNGFPRSESRESVRSVTSTHSDTIFEKVNRQTRNGISPLELQIKHQSASLHSAVNFDSGNSNDSNSKGLLDKKYTLRYMNVIPERLKPGEPLPDLRACKNSASTISWATAPSQEAASSKGSLHLSAEDNLSMSNSCDSSNSKVNLDSHSNSCNFTRAESTSPFNDVSNYNFPLKSIVNAMSPMEDPFNEYAETDLDQPTDYSIRYAEQTSDDDKQSSAYFTGTEHEQDTVKTYCTEGTPYQGSLNSSRASSASDLREENKLKAHVREISHSTQRISSDDLKHLNSNANIEQDLKSMTQVNIKVSSTTDSLPSMVSESSTLEAGRSLESDSAIFGSDHKFEHSSGVPSFNSLIEDEPKLVNNTKKKNDMQYDAKKESFQESTDNFNDRTAADYAWSDLHKQSHRQNSFNTDLHSKNNLVRYQTNTCLNDIEIQDLNEDMISGNRAPLTSLESVDNQQFQDDEDCSEITYTNDYYTVQETYTVDKFGKTEEQKPFTNDDCSVSQQCSSTLSYMSLDDKDCRFNVLRNDNELIENATDNLQNNFTLNSENLKSFDSIEKSEQVLLELCINSEVKKSEIFFTDINATSQQFIGEDITDTSRKTNVSTNKNNILQTGEIKGKNQEEYRRQRDPDAMIASLDRLTATLVQQTEAIRERDSSTMKASLLSDTWNEDSPNEVSFPSISVSAPLVSSFKSDIQDDQLANDHCNSIPNSMTESKIIEIEAIKLAEAVSAEANQISLTCLDLDAINPPSTMGSLLSLTASIGGTMDNGDNLAERSRCHSTSLPSMQSSTCRKKSLPIGWVARRVLNHGQNRTGSLENLLNECNNCNNSQLENVKPPSIMDELLDVGDMENSMLSVASITSEIAESKDNDSNSLTSSDVVFDFIKPVANVLSIACIRNAEAMQGSANNSLSECLDNINPPSLFNEVSEMDESTMDVNTNCDTLCIDAELYSEEATHCAFDERIEEIANDTDEAATPISSEPCSSVESTPKKRLYENHSGHLTPKQKRQQAKERYKTYTIAAERVRKEQEDRKKQEQCNSNISKNLDDKPSPGTRLTPKQRRQEDRARFQTQVLDTPILSKIGSNDFPENEDKKISNIEKGNVQSTGKTGIPMLRKYTCTKTFKSNQSINQENKESLSTKTLNEDTASYESYENHRLHCASSSEIKTMEKNTNNYLNSEKNQTNEVIFLKHDSDSLSHDEFKIENPTQSLKNKVSEDFNYVNDDHALEIASTDDDTANQIIIVGDREVDDESELESENDSENKETQEVKRPRIVKPGTLYRELSVESNTNDKPESEIPKSIRGRRKPLYSTPNTRKSTPQSSPLKQVALVSRSNTSPIVRPTRAMTLRQNNSVQKTKSTPKMNGNNNGIVEKRISNVNNMPKRSSIPQKTSTFTRRVSTPNTSNEIAAQKVETPIKPLERQGTFTKDEPEMENAPMVMPMSPCKSNFTKSTNINSKTSPKSSPINGKSKISLRTPHRLTTSKLTKTTSVERISTPTGIPTIAKRSSTNLCGSVIKSSSNYQISPNNESGIPRKISLNHRSISNSSIVSNVSGQGTRKMVKEATSKIASLWKKVEENKNKQRHEKSDKRQWITPNRTSTQVDSPNENEEQTCRLSRSSTFEGVDSTNGSNDSSQN